MFRSALRFVERVRFRPGFMTVTVAVALLASPSFGLLASRLSNSRAVAQELAQEADAQLREEMLARGWERVPAGSARQPATVLESTRGVEVLTATRRFRLELASGGLGGEPASQSELALATNVLAHELGRYPRQFLEKSRLRRVVLTRSLSEGGASIPSLPNFEGALLLDVDASEAFLRRLIHHEVFHFMDYAGDDQLQRDPVWQNINDRWFVYGSGGRFARVPGSAQFTAELPGFVSRYATSALEEDKAETFAFLMAAPAPLRTVVLRDAIVRTKIATVKAELERFCPEIDGHFWARGGSI